MDFRIQVVLQALSLRYSKIFAFLHRELVNLLVQPPFTFFLCWILVAQHWTSLMQILILTTEPFVGLWGLDPSSKIFQPNKLWYY